MNFRTHYHEKYLKHWRILCAVWVLFALSILHVIVLVYPEWIGDSHGAYFGLYNYCVDDDCAWSILEVKQFSAAFTVTLFLVLAATLLNVLVVLSIMLLVLLRDHYVLLICSWMHLFSFFSMLGSCIIFPAGWDHSRVREVCDSDRYRLGFCEMKWAYAMAFVLVVDEFVLSIFGFILASKQPSSVPEIHVSYDLPSLMEKEKANQSIDGKEKQSKCPAGKREESRHAAKPRPNYLA
ncbi:hypothetical protein QR680_002941 [Steinernema hermaphroditum]|uniref:Uncharacterized protein n=1 Tax=Steinernema hermaphroditum TaxID=289476 RepID=A0AA39H6L1_9BILA|nr:hypothetical protein QR680_002941 [Steinernema hermaphroditum]